MSDRGPFGRFQVDIEAAARTLGVSIQFLPANNEDEIDIAFAKLGQLRADALLVGPGPFLDSRREKLVALAAKVAIPTAYENEMASGCSKVHMPQNDPYQVSGDEVQRFVAILSYSRRTTVRSGKLDVDILRPIEIR